MDIPRRPEGPIDVEGDDLDTVARKLGVETPLGAERIVLTEENLRYLNGERDADGNTILMRFAKLGKEDIVEFLVKCDGIRVNERNRKYDTAADIALSERNFGCLLKLLQGEAELPYIRDVTELQHTSLVEFVEQRKKLHEHIESGDLLAVKEFTKNHKPSMYLSYKFEPFFRIQSALTWAAECNQLEVYAYLCSHGAKFKDLDEEKKCRFNERQRKELNGLLEEYLVKANNSHVMKLMQSSQSPQEFSDARKAKIRDIYDHLNKSEFVSLMMKVLEFEDVDVVFDFQNEHTNNVYCVNKSQIYGFTLPSKQRIFIGAKKCESAENVNLDVAGTLAHELCHMAMDVLYRNKAKPYEAGEEGMRMFEKYKAIVKCIEKECVNSPEKTDPVLKSVFKDEEEMWHSEMIVRVPEILAMYGDIEGKAKLQEQAKGLFEFYVDHVVPKCKEYTDFSFYNKGLRIIEPLHKHHGCVQDVEKGISPLKTPSKSFRDYLIPKGNISLIFTSNTSLCCLHVYHELKRSHSCHMDKQCLFFKLQCFKSNWEMIIHAFMCKVCRYLILVTDEKLLNLKDICEYFDDVKGCGESTKKNISDDQKKVILIVGEECTGLHDCDRKDVLSYQWSDLSDHYKQYLIRQNYGLLVNFKGKEMKLMRWIDQNRLAEVIEPEDIQRLTNNEPIQLGDGRQLTTKGHNVEYYMEREFVKHTVSKSVFRKPPDSTVLFVTGLRRKDLKGIDVDRRRIQWIKRFTTKFHADKRIFVQAREEKVKQFFDKLSRSNVSFSSVYWLHFSKGEFYLRNSRGSTKSFEKHIKEDLFTERELVEGSKQRVVLISDDPGMGKTTVLTELIRKMRDLHPDWWLGRINLNEYAYGKENPLGLANIEEDSSDDDVLEVFVRMLGMKTKLQVHIFKQMVKPKGLKREFKIFFDAYDEVSPSYRGNVLRLFRCLMERTSLQVWITTRRHEKLCLEKEFDAFSYSLKELTADVQVAYLDRLWKYRIKSILDQNLDGDKSRAIEKVREKIESILVKNEGFSDDIFKSLSALKDQSEETDSNVTTFDELKSYIDKLNFSQIAKSLLEGTSSQDRFVGIPLYLAMLGVVVYDNKFRQEMYSNVHILYSNFFVGKIRVLVTEKANLQIENDIGRAIFMCVKEKISHFHESVAKCIVDPDRYPWDSIVDDDVLGLNTSVGILSKSGDQFQFAHRTFAEFFFSEWLLEMFKHGQLVEGMLRNVMRDVRYSVVRRFLDDAFQRGDVRNSLNKALMQKWDLAALFEISMTRAVFSDFTGKWFLRVVTSEFEKRNDPTSVKVFLERVSKHLCEGRGCLNTYALKLVSFCFSDAIISHFIIKLVETELECVFITIMSSPASEVSELFDVFKRAHQTRAPHSTTGDTLRENEGNGVTPETGDENIIGLLEGRDKCGHNLLQCTLLNEDINVFLIALGLAKDVLREEELAKYVMDRGDDGSTIIHFCALHRKDIFTVISNIKSMVDPRSLSDVLRARDNRDNNFLMFAAGTYECKAFKSLLEFLDETEDTMVRDLLSQESVDGCNVFHYAAINSDTDTQRLVFGKARKELKDELKLKELVTKSSVDGRTVFHLGATHWRPARDLTVPLESYFGREVLRELLTKVNDKEETWLHTLFSACLDKERLLDGLSVVSELFDADSLEKFILASDAKGDTILHVTARSPFFRDKCKDILRALKGCLSESSFELLINKRNNEGETVKIVESGDANKLKLHREEMEGGEGRE